MEQENNFTKLFEMNVNDYTETKKNGDVELTYLSWAWAWAMFKKERPAAHYSVSHWDGKPYVYDEVLGYMVETNVYDGFEEHSMWLPVMDNTNHAMKNKPYEYTTRKGDKKTVPAATMFDINTAIMRCLVKNIGMFGLGLYIYAGEDLPDGETVKQGSKAKRNVKPTIAEIIDGINEKMTLDNCKKFYAKAIEHYGKDLPEYKQWVDAWVKKKEALEAEGIKADLAADEAAINEIVDGL